MLTIRNRHYGTPPDFQPDSAAFLSYFEGTAGDQWVFRYENGDTAMLYGGDIGWEGRTVPLEGRYADLVLSRTEQMWLETCRLAVCEAREVSKASRLL